MSARSSGRTARRSSARSTRASRSRPRRRSTATSIAAGSCRRRAERHGGPNDAVDWRRDLGGGTRVALIQAGTFRSDAGALFGPGAVGPVGRPGRGRARRQPAPPPGAQLPADRDARRAGCWSRPGSASGSTTKTPTMRGYEGPPVVPALEAAGFAPGTIDVVAMSHLHFDHAGGLLLADGSRAFPRARIVAQRAEWEIALGDNPRLVASYVQPELRLVRGLGRGGLGRGRARAPAGRLGRSRPAGTRPATRRSSCVGRTGCPDARVLRRPVHAAVGRQPTLGHLVRRLPARLRRGQGRAVPPAAEEDWIVVLSHERAADRAPRPRSRPVPVRGAVAPPFLTPRAASPRRAPSRRPARGARCPPRGSGRPGR